jgi:hypothetical protein
MLEAAATECEEPAAWTVTRIELTATAGSPTAERIDLEMAHWGANGAVDGYGSLLSVGEDYDLAPASDR